MKACKKLIRILSSAALLASMNIANAALVEINQDSNSPAQTINIHPDDTANGAQFHNGVINNQGLIEGFYILQRNLLQNTVTLNNSGNIFFNQGITAGGLTLNHDATGHVVFTNYIDAYQTSTIENAGTIIIANALGDGIADHDGGSVPFTYMYQGLIHNTGKFLVQRNNIGAGNVCEQTSRVLTLKNEGYLEIADGSKCDFGTYSMTTNRKSSFIQDGGETHVDGIFGAHELTINKGVISGSGTIQGYFNDSPLNNKVTIAPGSSLETGTLTLIPDETYLMCVWCSITIELASATNADQVHVDGTFYMNNWKLNVQLRDGYVPATGTSFTVVSADLVHYYGPAPTYNLPKLPNGRTWNVQNNGTEVILTAN